MCVFCKNELNSHLLGRVEYMKMTQDEESIHIIYENTLVNI